MMYTFLEIVAVAVLMIVAVGDAFVLRGRVDFCNVKWCDEAKPVCGVVNDEMDCMDYNSGEDLQVDVDLTGLITVNSIRVSLMTIQGNIAYWRNVELRKSFAPDERERGNLYRVKENSNGFTFLRYYGYYNPLTTTSNPSTRPHDHTTTQLHSTHRPSTSERIHTTTQTHTSTVTHTTDRATQPLTRQPTQTQRHTTDRATQTQTHRPTQTQTHTTDRHTTHSITHVQTTKRLLTSPITFANTTMSKSKVKHNAGNGLEWWCYLVIGLVLFFFIILGFCIYRCKKRNIIYSNIELGEVNLGAVVEESV